MIRKLYNELERERDIKSKKWTDRKLNMYREGEREMGRMFKGNGKEREEKKEVEIYRDK